MSDAIEIRKGSPQHTVFMRGDTLLDAVIRQIAQWLPILELAVAKQHGVAAGPVYARLHSREGKIVDMEVGLPVQTLLTATGQVSVGELPGGDLAVLTHEGAYAGIPALRRTLIDWVRENGRSAAGSPWLSFVIHRKGESDVSKWRTELILPLEPE